MSSFCTVPKTSSHSSQGSLVSGSSTANATYTATATATSEVEEASTWFVDSPSRQPDLVKILDDSVFVSQLSKPSLSGGSSGIGTEHFLVINDFCQNHSVDMFAEKFRFSNDVDENVVKYRAPSDLHRAIGVSKVSLDSSTPIQCLASRGTLVAAVNSSNEVFLTKLNIDSGVSTGGEDEDSNSNSDSPRNKHRRLNVRSRYCFDEEFGVKKHQLTSGSNPKCGWVGLSLDKDTTAVTANYLTKSLLWSDLETGKQISTVSLLSNPTALFQQRDEALLSNFNSVSSSNNSSGSNGGCVYVCEGGVFSAWDRNRLVVRETVSRGALWTIDRGLEQGNEYDLYLGGEDRNVYVYDIRKWKCRLKWKAPCKYDITKLLLVNGKPNSGVVSDSLLVNSLVSSSSNNNSSSNSNSSSSSSSSSRFFLGGGDNEVLLCDSAVRYLQVGSAAPTTSTSTDTTTAPSSSSSSSSSDTNDIGNGSSDSNSNSSSNSNSMDIKSDAAAQVPASSKLRLSHHRGVRSEARWAGLDARWTATHGSVVVGMCEMGNYYILRNGQSMTVSNNSNCSSAI